MILALLTMLGLLLRAGFQLERGPSDGCSFNVLRVALIDFGGGVCE